jgi:hypothetical protein
MLVLGLWHGLSGTNSNVNPCIDLPALGEQPREHSALNLFTVRALQPLQFFFCERFSPITSGDTDAVIGHLLGVVSVAYFFLAMFR